MKDLTVSRRDVFVVGSAAAVGLVSMSGPAAAEHAADPNTSIHDSLSPTAAAMLTETARGLTEGDAVRLNRSLRDPDTPLPEHLQALSHQDIQSLHKAFQHTHEETYDISSLAPSLVAAAHAGDACCCCTPASCCCAAAQTVETRSRQIA